MTTKRLLTYEADSLQSVPDRMKNRVIAKIGDQLYYSHNDQWLPVGSGSFDQELNTTDSVEFASVKSAQFNQYRSLQYGEALTAGQVAYQKPADKKLYKASGAALATISYDLFYIETSGDADDIKSVLKSGWVTGSGFTVGAGFISKDTPGAVVTTAFSTVGTWLRQCFSFESETLAYFQQNDVIAGF